MSEYFFKLDILRNVKITAISSSQWNVSVVIILRLICTLDLNSFWKKKIEFLDQLRYYSYAILGYLTFSISVNKVVGRILGRFLVCLFFVLFFLVLIFFFLFFILFYFILFFLFFIEHLRWLFLVVSNTGLHVHTTWNASVGVIHFLPNK